MTANSFTEDHFKPADSLVNAVMVITAIGLGADSIDKFSKKTKEEKDQFLNDIKDICLYNQNLFLEYSVNSWKKNLENLEMCKTLNFLLNGKKSLI